MRIAPQRCLREDGTSLATGRALSSGLLVEFDCIEDLSGSLQKLRRAVGVVVLQHYYHSQEQSHEPKEHWYESSETDHMLATLGGWCPNMDGERVRQENASLGPQEMGG